MTSYCDESSQKNQNLWKLKEIHLIYLENNTVIRNNDNTMHVIGFRLIMWSGIAVRSRICFVFQLLIYTLPKRSLLQHFWLFTFSTVNWSIVHCIILHEIRCWVDWADVLAGHVGTHGTWRQQFLCLPVLTVSRPTNGRCTARTKSTPETRSIHWRSWELGAGWPRNENVSNVKPRWTSCVMISCAWNIRSLPSC